MLSADPGLLRFLWLGVYVLFSSGCSSESESTFPMGQTLLDQGLDQQDAATDVSLDDDPPGDTLDPSDASEDLADLLEDPVLVDRPTDPAADQPTDPAVDPVLDGSSDLDMAGDDSGDQGGAIPVPEGCGFTYEEEFGAAKLNERNDRNVDVHGEVEPGRTAHAIAHWDPNPPFVYALPTVFSRGWFNIVMPGYDDDMPLFERGTDWDTAMRCYETPEGAFLYTEERAYEVYRAIAETTTGIAVDTSPEVRSVVGLRGAYPGTFLWHGNTPNRFNDTLALLWIDEDGQPHVREFHAHTDVGAYDFGTDSSSSLRPNRRYRYLNGWHRSYNALQIAETNYWVRNDTNHNGHWDSDRNGWLPPAGDDYDRVGSAHNIHMASVDGPLGQARVAVWSAGCQVIPGIANWTEFITHAWTEEDDPVNYFLIDTRDIPLDVWSPCTPDGTMACPYPIEGTSFVWEGDTSIDTPSELDRYNCSTADESGPEVVFVFTVGANATVDVEVECEDPVVDIDVQLLDGSDPNACIDRDHWAFSAEVTPGRYWIVADTWVDGAGTALSGPFTLRVDID